PCRRGAKGGVAAPTTESTVEAALAPGGRQPSRAGDLRRPSVSTRRPRLLFVPLGVQSSLILDSLELQLHLVQPLVNPIFRRQQLTVRFRLGQTSLPNHEQPRRSTKRRQPVRDSEHGSAGNQPLERFLDLSLR